jgi:hypothetical protein
VSISATTPEAEQQRRRENVPLYNDNFNMRVRHEPGRSADDQYGRRSNNKPTWEQNVRLAQMVDQAGFEAADYFLKLAKAGCDGVCFSPIGYWEDTVRLVIDGVLPMLEQAGVRKPFRRRTV